MASPRIEYAVLPAGDGPGQDRCFTADGLVVVLDGASAIDPVANPDATEYVDTLGPLLIEQITAMSGIDLRDALAEAIRLTAEELALVPGTAPSSTVSVVRWGEETVDVLVLGDSPVVIQSDDGHRETVVQHSQDHIAPELRRRYRDRLANGRGYDDEHRSILRSIQREEAVFRNLDGGYWIAEAVPAAAYASLVVRRSVSAVRLCLVASDGAESVTKSVLSSSSLPQRASLSAALESRASWERDADPSGRIAPRSKLHDDKTLAAIFAR